jgi:hypothetical protein
MLVFAWKQLTRGAFRKIHQIKSSTDTGAAQSDKTHEALLVFFFETDEALLVGPESFFLKKKDDSLPPLNRISAHDGNKRLEKWNAARRHLLPRRQ